MGCTRPGLTSYQFGLMKVSGIVPVSWTGLLRLPARVRDNCRAISSGITSRQATIA